ncbi:MAG TPA: hypothetical protein VFW28_01240 [Micropepsaceae bacterium]|nr:hypothetical protein [Micropepsaceae bacterium]
MRIAEFALISASVILSAVAMAQPANKDKLPQDAEHFACGNVGYTLKGDTLVLDQTQDVYRILQNNRYGIVATSSMSEFVPKLKKVVVAFWSIAIDRSTGQAVLAEEESGSAPEAAVQLTCEPL